MRKHWKQSMTCSGVASGLYNKQGLRLSAHLATQGLHFPQQPPCCVDNTFPSGLSLEPQLHPPQQQATRLHRKCSLPNWH